MLVDHPKSSQSPLAATMRPEETNVKLLQVPDGLIPRTVTTRARTRQREQRRESCLLTPKG